MISKEHGMIIGLDEGARARQRLLCYSGIVIIKSYSIEDNLEYRELQWILALE